MDQPQSFVRLADGSSRVVVLFDAEATQAVFGRAEFEEQSVPDFVRDAALDKTKLPWVRTYNLTFSQSTTA